MNPALPPNWANQPRKHLTYISFGGGVQSTALLILSALGLRGVPRADVAIFADTQAEIAETYAHVKRMTTWAAERGIEVRTVTAGSLTDDVLHGKGESKSCVAIPAYTVGKVWRPNMREKYRAALFDFAESMGVTIKVEPELKPESPGEWVEGEGHLNRHCTYDYKMVPIVREVRRLLGITGKPTGDARATCLLGISVDEAGRMKPAREEWMTNQFPLVDARISREECRRIIGEHGIEQPPRSACYFCPFHSLKYWKWLRDYHPAEFERACVFDEQIRHGLKAVQGTAYLSAKRKPLREINLDGNGQREIDGFENECEGHCGI